MSDSMPIFDQVSEYARFGGMLPDVLRKKIHPVYPGEVRVIVAPDDTPSNVMASQYVPRVRGFLYHHGLDLSGGQRSKTIASRHLISQGATQKLMECIGLAESKFIVQIIGFLACYMNHDMLHGFNGEPTNFTHFDHELIFGGVEFFPLMAHSEVFLRWLKRDKNQVYILNLQRNYIDTLKPLADKFDVEKDPELLRVLDYFVLIYLKCLLTIIPVSHEIVKKFLGRTTETLYKNLPPYALQREKLEKILASGLERAQPINNYTLFPDKKYDRRKTGAAQEGCKLIDTYFPDGLQVKEVEYTTALVVANLLTGACFRMVPNMPRPDNLQRQFKKIYTS